MQKVAEIRRIDVPAPPQKRATPLVALGLALGVLWFICCRHLSQEWRFNEQYSYGWFVPFFAVYLFWLRWHDRPAAESPESKVESRSAVVVIAAAALILLPLRLFEIANPDWRPLGWVHGLAAAGITLAIINVIGGKPWLRHFSFPILFFLVAVPWPSPIEAPIVEGLMRGVAAMAAETVSLFGIPAEVQDLCPAAERPALLRTTVPEISI
jgi:Transmembrane exosortase (Exosortase_EpsH)